MLWKQLCYPCSFSVPTMESLVNSGEWLHVDELDQSFTLMKITALKTGSHHELLKWSIETNCHAVSDMCPF